MGGLRAPFTFTNCFWDIAQGLGVVHFVLTPSLGLPLLLRLVWLKKLDSSTFFTYSLIVLTIGSVIRIFNLPLLYLGTLLIRQVTIFNVLLPSAIQTNHPQKIWLSDSASMTSMGNYNGSCFLSLYRLLKQALGKA